VADCPAEYEKAFYLFGELDPADQARVSTHIDSCPRCAEDLASLRRTAEVIEAREDADRPESDADCLNEAQLAAWLDGGLNPEARASILWHLAGCAKCRSVTASLVRTLRSDQVAAAIRDLEHGDVRERGPWRRLRGLPRLGRVGTVAAAIAAVFAGILLLRPIDVKTEKTPSHRGAVPDVMSAPEPTAPVGELETVDVFTWSPVTGADLYRITVFDEQGGALWEAETTQTRLARPPSVRLERGSRYFWKVAARVGWDRLLESKLVTFTISEP